MKKTRVALDDRQFAFVAASVAAAVLAHISHLPIALAILIAAIVLAAWILRTRRGIVAPAWIKLPLIALLPALVILYYGNVFGREPGSAFVCGMLALKLLETTTRRDARAAVCFASFVLMSALLFDKSLAFTMLLLGIATLLLATLRELEPRAPAAPTVTGRATVLLSLRQGGLALVAAVPLAICAFVFFPRLDAPLWRLPGDDIAHTGLSDSMTPGSIQTLLVDDSPAFRVVFDGSPPSHRRLYWRGPVLTDFDGTTWTRRDAVALPASAQLQTGSALSYEVTLEPNDKPWLFALDAPLDAPAADSIRAADLTIIRQRPVSDLLRYRAQSSLDYRLDVALPAYLRRRALALPVGFNPRSIELARSWRHDLANDDAVIAKALDLFHGDFTYTLSPPALGRDSSRRFCLRYETRFLRALRRCLRLPHARGRNSGARRDRLPGWIPQYRRATCSYGNPTHTRGRRCGSKTRAGCVSIRPPP